MTTDYRAKEAKIKELIANATKPRDKAFYERLLKKAIASRPKQIVAVAKSVESEENDSEASVREKETSSSTSEAEESPSSKQNKLSEKKIEDNALASEMNELLKQLMEAKSQLPKGDSQSKSQSQASQESKEQKEPRPKEIFQGIGVIKGLVVYGDGKLKIQMEEKKYEIYTGGHPEKKKKFEALKQEIQAQGSSEQVVVVNPQVHYFKKGEEGSRRVSFRVVSSQKANAFKVNWHELREREFKLSGLWQYIPRCSEPCLTIRRNWSASLEKEVERMTRLELIELLKPAHLPIEWSDAPVEAFRYSPELEQEGKKAWFVRVKAVFVPEFDKFKVIEQLGEPTLERPRYLSAYP